MNIKGGSSEAHVRLILKPLLHSNKTLCLDFMFGGTRREKSNGDYDKPDPGTLLLQRAPIESVTR